MQKQDFQLKYGFPLYEYPTDDTGFIRLNKQRMNGSNKKRRK